MNNYFLEMILFYSSNYSKYSYFIINLKNEYTMGVRYFPSNFINILCLNLSKMSYREIKINK